MPQYPSISELLVPFATDPPGWLVHQRAGDLPDLEAFLKSRTVFYPGSRLDGHPMEIFGGSRSAHCFVFVDYDCYTEEVVSSETLPGGDTFLKDYDVVNHQYVTENELLGGRIHWLVMERRNNATADQIPTRLCLLLMHWEAVAAYEFLYGRPQACPPYAVVLQDHGGDLFGGDSPLSRLAFKFGKPEWLFVADLSFTWMHDIGHSSTPWPGYERVSSPLPGGDFGTLRSLFRHQPDVERYFADPFSFVSEVLKASRRENKQLWARYAPIRDDVLAKWDDRPDHQALWAEHLSTKYWLWDQCIFLQDKLQHTPSTAEAVRQAWQRRIDFHPAAVLSCPAFMRL
ncbi:MAG: hypothetical protein HS117_18545 [Verrucomicrobiaceae bacterium]|nr:hypothetical protein [Verrucomicrobiaceae bacterium]